MTSLDTATARSARRCWWQDMVLYEAHLPSLRDGNGDGVGDLYGLIDSLDYLADLGVTAIWTGPFYRSPLQDQGFDISDHCQVEPRFGDLQAVDRLLAEAHARGIRIIVDYVPNHTSDQHPWFQASRSSRQDPQRDWYIWADATDHHYPNNWTSEAGGSVWEYDEPTGQFYLHSHLKEQPDLNWRNPAVRSAMHDVLRYWLDRGVDGFRVDVAHMLAKDPELRDNPPNPHGANPYDLQHPDFDAQLHVHDRMHPDLHEMLREIRTVIDSYPGDRVTIGEIQAMDWEDWARYFGEHDELHLPFAFAVLETPWEPAALSAVLANMDAALPQGAWPVVALGNHDRPRLASRLGRRQARVAAVLLLTLRGVPCLYYGDELGLIDQEVPRPAQRDFFGLAAGGVSRDPARTPMPWDDGPHSGFAPANATDLWLPISHEYRTVNVASQRARPDSLLSLYRELIRLRHRSPALTAGSWHDHSRRSTGCLAYQRRSGTDCKLIALNLTDRPQHVQLDQPGTVALATGPGRAGAQLVGTVTLTANEGLVLDLGAA